MNYNKDVYMKRNIFLLMQFSLQLLFFAFTFIACNNEDKQLGEDGELSIKYLYPKIVEPGQVLSITGTGFSSVSEVYFAGDVVATSIQKVGLNQIDVVVPDGIQDGPVTLKGEQGSVVSETQVRVAAPAVSVVYPTEVKTGEVLFIKGTDLKNIDQVVFPDDVIVNAVDFVRKNDVELQVKVPKGTIDGSGIVKVVSKGGKIINAGEVAITVVDEPVGGDVIRISLFEGSFDIGNWSADLMMPCSLLTSDVVAGAKFVIEYEIQNSGAQLKVKRSNNQNSTFDNSIPNGWGIDLPDGSSSFDFEITQGDLDFMAEQVDDNIVIQGKNAIIKKVYIEVEKPAEIILFEGDFDIGNWSADLLISNEGFAQVTAGSTFMIEYEMKDTWAQLKVKRSNSQNSTFENSTPNGWGIDLSEGSTSFGFEITQGDLDFIAGLPGDDLAIQGSNAVIKRVLVIP